MEVDVLIVGGGIAGLWTLDQLRRRGYRVLLAETRGLGTGQTVSSQGIIHGGLKYSLRGMLTASAREIREMPLVWRECLSGRREPNLTRTLIRSHFCYLWQTSSFSSQAGMLGAQLNLQVKPQPLNETQRPEVLRGTPGQIFRLDEQVLSPTSLLEAFRARNLPYLLQISPEKGTELVESVQQSASAISEVVLQQGNRSLRLRPRCVILTAGAGNAALSARLGCEQPMQKRPLHMVMLRGPLPLFQGHCIDGAKTRLTITSEVLSQQETVWQLGGQLAEQGVSQSAEEVIRKAIHELQATLPQLDLTEAQFASYVIDRAERKMGVGLRPDTPQILRDRNVLTCWPTKLAFAPRVADVLEGKLRQELRIEPPPTARTPPDWLQACADWERPPVAAPPWAEERIWFRWNSQSDTLQTETAPPQATSKVA